jgi:hypothetical protein
MYMGNDDRAFREFNTQELIGNAKPNSEGIFRIGNDVRVLCRRAFSSAALASTNYRSY